MVIKIDIVDTLSKNTATAIDPLFKFMLMWLIILLTINSIHLIVLLIIEMAIKIKGFILNRLYITRMNRLIEKKFKDKVDKAGKPYILHLKEVAKNAPNLETKLVALGHDLIEDTDITEHEFIYRYKLPQSVWDKIEILSREDGESYKEYIDRLIENKDETILFVKMEDLKHNMDLSRLETITKEDIERNKKYEKHLKRIIKAYKELQ